MVNVARTFVVGTRSSRLAVAQTQAVLRELRRLRPSAAFQVQELKTEGDRNYQLPLASWGLGIFVKDIERRLLDGRIDIAIHSLKDVPAEETSGLLIAAIPTREDPQEVFVGRAPLHLEELPSGARIGTSSLRRQAFLRAYRADLEIVPVRGNVDTRIRRVLTDDELDGIVLAAAGLRRLGLEEAATQYLPYQVCMPAPGQGALAVQVRADDHESAELVSAVHDQPTAAAVGAERELLRLLGGGCQVPIGAVAEAQPGGRLQLQAAVGAPDGSRVMAGEGFGTVHAPAEVAAMVADRLRQSGADKLLAQFRS